MHKVVSHFHQRSFKQAFPGLTGVDIMAHTYPIEPFLVFTEFHMNQPVFGPHPHAGISVMTYILPDSQQGFINRDSQGDFSYIQPGGVHIMQAGSGMHHDEFPKTPGIDAHGFQIWINHAHCHRMAPPTSMHADAHHIPEVVTPVFRLRIIHGHHAGLSSPYTLLTPVQLFHIFLEPYQTLELPAQEMTFVYGLAGQGRTGNKTIGAQSLVIYDPNGDTIALTADKEGLECMFASGAPHHEPLVYGGPFVMTTQEQMIETQQRYATGAMGQLPPFQPQ